MKPDQITEQARPKPLPPAPGSDGFQDKTTRCAIYSEYYSHVGTECYKVKLPWTKYRESVLVLCPVSEGIDTARRIAMRELTARLRAAIFAKHPNGQALPHAGRKSTL